MSPKISRAVCITSLLVVAACDGGLLENRIGDFCSEIFDALECANNDEFSCAESRLQAASEELLELQSRPRPGYALWPQVSQSLEEIVEEMKVVIAARDITPQSSASIESRCQMAWDMY